jgi:primosomal protein N' (replication factor Y)
LESLFANIALDTPLDQTFTYSIPDYLINDVKAGSRVLVPFGNRTLTGFVLSISDKTDVTNIKQVYSVLDIEPFLSAEMLDFSRWVADYYLAPIGEVVSLFIPKNISIQSEINYKLTDNYFNALNSLTKANEIVFDIVGAISKAKDKKLTRKQIENKLSKNVSYNLDFLVKNGILEKLMSYTSATKEVYTKYVKSKFKEPEIDEIIHTNKIKTAKQIELLKLMSISDKIELSDLSKRYKFSASTVNSLVKKSLLEYVEVKKIRKPESFYSEAKKDLFLNDEQQEALNVIDKSVIEKKFNVHLLYGITGSGKTEVYIRALEEVLKLGKTAIVLVPEISLTPQLISRFKNKFSEIVGVIHSKLSEGERLDTFIGVREKRIKIVIGPRSALFAPLTDIGIIIVDEEHDSSYKQENSPR